MNESSKHVKDDSTNSLIKTVETYSRIYVISVKHVEKIIPCSLQPYRLRKRLRHYVCSLVSLVHRMMTIKTISIFISNAQDSFGAFCVGNSITGR